MGRITQVNRGVIGPVPPYNSSTVYFLGGVPTISTDHRFTYYLNGDLLDIFLPGGIPNYRFQTDENTAGRVIVGSDIYSWVVGGGQHYSKYAPNGALATALVGWQNSGYAGTSVSNTYNNRLQPVTTSVSTASNSAIMNLVYNFHSGSGDNGNVFGVTNNRDNNRSQAFGYDSLNRLTTASTTGPNWGETYYINAFGVLWQRSGIKGKTWFEPLSCLSNTKNQLSACSFQYDAAGNMTYDGNHYYTYDAENPIVSVDHGAYSSCTMATGTG
jgi:hypothetical protein